MHVEAMKNHRLSLFFSIKKRIILGREGYRQAVRHLALTQTFGSSNLSSPAI